MMIYVCGNKKGMRIVSTKAEAIKDFFNWKKTKKKVNDDNIYTRQHKYLNSLCMCIYYDKRRFKTFKNIRFIYGCEAMPR